MTPDTLLTELNTRGIVLRRAGDQLMVSDPDRALTPGLSALIKKHKPALLALLNIPRDVAQLPLAAATEESPAAARSTETPARSPIAMRPGEVITLPGIYRTLPADEIAHALATANAIGLAVHEWPADPVRCDLLWAMTTDPRCVEFYAADLSLCDAIDREREGLIARTQARFARALANARSLATEITTLLERIEQ